MTDIFISTLLAFPCQCHSANTPLHSLLCATPEATDSVHNSRTLPSPSCVLILNPPSHLILLFCESSVMNLFLHVGGLQPPVASSTSSKCFSQHPVLKCPLYVLSLELVTNFHTQTKQHVQLQIRISQFSHFYATERQTIPKQG